MHSDHAVTGMSGAVWSSHFRAWIVLNMRSRYYNERIAYVELIHYARGAITDLATGIYWKCSVSSELLSGCLKSRIMQIMRCDMLDATHPLPAFRWLRLETSPYELGQSFLCAFGSAFSDFAPSLRRTSITSSRSTSDTSTSPQVSMMPPA